jgi:hypothetical protein
MLMELAYRLATEDSPVINQIRERDCHHHTVAEPDGRDRYVGGTIVTRSTRRRRRQSCASCWGKYIFHDNNRDINYSQVTMRTLLTGICTASADHARVAQSYRSWHV